MNFHIETFERRRLLSVNIAVHHGDAYNDGANLSEVVLTPANVNSADFGKLFTTTLDGAIFAQPLYVENVNIIRGSSLGMHSVIYVATMHNSLYAIDANTGNILWQDNFCNIATPTNLTATVGVTTVPASDLGSTNLGTELGVLATPAIDNSTGVIYLNANSKEIRGADTHFVQRLWAINIANGNPIVAPAVIGDTISNNTFYSFTGYTYVSGPLIDGTGNNATPLVYPNTDGWTTAPAGKTTPVIAFNALIQMQRTSMTLMNGSVYLGFASHGDNGPYYGWILGYSETTLAPTAVFNTVPTYEGIVGNRANYTAQGGIWASGSAMATDGTYMYVTTGNGAFNSDPSDFDASGFPKDHDYADCLIKIGIDPNSSQNNQNGNGWGLKVADYFAPSNTTRLNQLDLDLGSAGVTLLPDGLKDSAGDPMLVFAGKESRIYLADRNSLGKFNFNYPISGDPDPRLYDRVLGEYAADGINGSSKEIFSTAAYFNGDIYVGVNADKAYEFNVSTFASGTVPPGTSFTPTPVATTALTWSYPSPSFTISANGSSAGLAWGIDTANSDLLAYDAGNFMNPIYSSNFIAGDNFSGGQKFSVVTVANGAAYLTTKTSLLVAYGLRSSYLNSNASYFSAPANVGISTAGSIAHVTWTSNSSLASEFRIDVSTDAQTWSTLTYAESSARSFDDTNDTSADNRFYRVVAISGSSSTTPSNIVAASLSIANNTTLTLPHGVFSANSLTITGTGRLDLNDSTLIVHNENIAALSSALATGINVPGGYWNGVGIISTAARTASPRLTALGIIQSGTDLLIKYTYYGDADLSGTVSGNDYTLIDAGFSSHGSKTGWSNGDFNFDGKVDGTDYSLIDNAFNTQLASLATTPISRPTAELVITHLKSSFAQTFTIEEEKKRRRLLQQPRLISGITEVDHRRFIADSH